jgi:hypothetical protein
MSEGRVTSSCEQEDERHDGCDVLQLLQVSQAAAAGEEHHEVEDYGHRIPAGAGAVDEEGGKAGGGCRKAREEARAGCDTGMGGVKAGC